MGPFLSVVFRPIEPPCDRLRAFGRPSGSPFRVRPLPRFCGLCGRLASVETAVRKASGGGGEAVAPGPREGSRMAHATAVPIAGRRPENRFVEASHKRPSASANGSQGVLGFTTAREGGSSFGGGQNRAVRPPARAEIGPRTAEITGGGTGRNGATESERVGGVGNASVRVKYTYLAHIPVSPDRTAPNTPKAND